MSFDFKLMADAIDYGFGTGFRPDYTVMAGAQLHVKTAPCIIDALTRFLRVVCMVGPTPMTPCTSGLLSTGWQRSAAGR